MAQVVLIVLGAFNDRDRDRKFANLNDLVNDVSIGVRRNGEVVQIHTSEIVVGDIVEVAYGNLIPADGVLVEGSDIRANEYALTGDDRDKPKSDEFPFLLAGTKMVGGYGYMMVVAVGEHTFKGNITKLLAVAEDTPTALQHKLEIIAHRVGGFGLRGMFALLVVLVGRFVIDFMAFGLSGGWRDRYITTLLRYLVNSVALLVVVVPESLSLAVSLATSHAITKMMKDHNLVRHIDCCETLGRATCICTDKTGTLTTNRMAVAKSWFGNEQFLQVPPLQDIGKELIRAAGECIAVTSTATLELQRTDDYERISVLGNKTEGALLMLSRYMGVEYERVRRQLGRLHFNTFTSDRKRTSTLVNNVNSKGLKTQAKRLYVTGAAEIVLRLCDFHLNMDGIRTTKLTDEKRAMLMDEVIGGFAKDGLRTIVLAYRVIEDTYGVDWDDPSTIEHSLVCIGVIGINDPLREEVPDAISECLASGITVRMVTGDSLETATSIAIRSRLFRKEDGDLAMEGADFRRRVTDSTGEIYKPEFDAIWPRLRVLARCSPQDKHTLVKGLREVADQVVVATGDSTADAAALTAADVGFGMGISGTDVAKDAADIILLNDSFHSIVDGVLWGRNMVDATCKFLQFQVTTSMVVTIVSVIGALLLREPPFSAIQLLWVNLIADPFGSLALATEGPSTNTAAGRQPYTDDQPLISSYMSRDIVGQVAYQVIVLLLLLLGGGVLVDLGWLPEGQAIDVFERVSTSHEGMAEVPCNQSGLLWHPYVAGRCTDSDFLTVVSDLHCELNGCDWGCGWVGGVRCGTVESALGAAAGRTDAELAQACEVNRNVWEANVTLRTAPSVGCTDPAGAAVVNASTADACTLTWHRWQSSVAAYCEVDSVPVLVAPDGSAHLTLIFNTFVLMTLFNTFHCRKVHNEANIFQGIFRHGMLMFLWPVVLLCHVILVQSFGGVMSTAKDGLDTKGWVLSMLLGASTLGWGLLLRLIPTRFCGRCARRWNEQAAELVDEETAKSMRNKRHHFCRCHVKGGKRLRAEFAQVRLRVRAPALKILTCLVAAPSAQSGPDGARAATDARGCARAAGRHGLRIEGCFWENEALCYSLSRALFGQRGRPQATVRQKASTSLARARGRGLASALPALGRHGRLLERVVGEQLLDQVYVREQHAAAAVAFELEAVKRLRLVHLRLQQPHVLLPLVPDDLRATRGGGEAVHSATRAPLRFPAPRGHGSARAPLRLPASVGQRDRRVRSERSRARTFARNMRGWSAPCRT